MCALLVSTNSTVILSLLHHLRSEKAPLQYYRNSIHQVSRTQFEEEMGIFSFREVRVS